MRTFFLLVSFVLFGFALQAQTLDSLFIRMPMAVVPYLDVSQRNDLVDFYDAKQKAVVKGRFDDVCELVERTESFLTLRIAEGKVVYQMKLVEGKRKKSYLLVAKTICSDLCVSELNVYDTEWNEVAAPQFTRLPAPSDFLKRECLKGEQWRMQRLLLSGLSIFPVSASISPDSPTIVYRHALSHVLDVDDYEAVKPIVVDSLEKRFEIKR